MVINYDPSATLLLRYENALYYVLSKTLKGTISLFHRAFQFTKYNGPTNALVYNKKLI
jgi:hypothetical protein